MPFLPVATEDVTVQLNSDGWSSFPNV